MTKLVLLVLRESNTKPPNRVLVVKPHNKTPYELFRGRNPALSFMRPFRCHVTILNTLDHLGKFDGNSDDGFFIGYSLNSTNSNDFVGTEEGIGEGVSEESEIDYQEKSKNSTQDVNIVGLSINTASTNVNTEVDLSNISNTYLVPSTPNTRIHKGHLLDHVIGDVQSGVLTRKITKTTNDQGFISAVYEGKTHEDLHICMFACFLSQEEPKKDGRGIVVRNKARLVAHAYTQEEGIVYEEIFALVTRIEAIRMFLAYASFKEFIVYEMDVKSAFMYGKIEEEVYVCQPPGLEDPEFLDKVYKVEKALYGLHQAPRACQEEEIDYDETFAPVARIEAIRIFIAFATYLNFIVFQMDVKSAFLNGKLKEKVYVKQPPSFESREFSDYVCKLDKALYGLKQAPMACYETLFTFLI
nr:retrovirus-related Pol polyprotein from transposon TNT 1-94 [Tanacetum cinerariifolium]